MAPTLFVTDDGSHSLHSERFGVNYHSTHGAIQESRHVFIEAGLRPLLTAEAGDLKVLEMGFGTGLNALLVRLLAPAFPALMVDYVTYERYPIGLDQAEELNYARELGCDGRLLQELHELEWGLKNTVDPNFSFTKHRKDFLATEENHGADVIFYDAFAPEKQPELWTVKAMEKCAAALRDGGVLVTYCAKGQFKRNLRAAGYRVEALPGPKGKREITRAYLC